MHVETFSLPHAWYRRTAAYLTRSEAENNLLLGIAYTLMNDPGAFPDFYLAAVMDGTRVVGAAMMTMPYKAILSHFEHPEAVGALVDDMRGRFNVLPGINGRKETCHAFAELWEARTGRKTEHEMAQRIYELRTVTPPHDVPGTLRPTQPDDIPLLAHWYFNFARDAKMESDRRTSVMWAERVFSHNMRRIFLWQVDGQPVSMAGATGPTPNGIRIGPVYTPQEYRGKGYASACTAAISQLMLDEGRHFCFLYTDLANPTSNKIYQQIGYTPVCDVDVIRFMD